MSGCSANTNKEVIALIFQNLHIHTRFSDGADTMEDLIQKAISLEMHSIGFSDHSDTWCDSSYCMKERDYPAYFEQIRFLKEKYTGILPVYMGIEKDYYSPIDSSCFDYVIASVHYLIRKGIIYPIDHSAKQQVDFIDDCFGGCATDMAKAYFETVAEHIQNAKPDIVGHFDIIAKFDLMPEADDRYLLAAEEAIRSIVKICPVFEVNTGAVAKGLRKVPCPSGEILKMIRHCGGKVVLSSDCHDQNKLTAFFPQTLELLRQAGFRHYEIFTPNGFQSLPIEE